MCNWAILTAVFYTLYIATINIYTKHFNAFSAFAFSALTPLAGRQEEHPACKN